MGADGGALARRLAEAAAAVTQIPSTTVTSLSWGTIVPPTLFPSYNLTCANVSGVEQCYNVSSNSTAGGRRLADAAVPAPRSRGAPLVRSLQASDGSTAAAVCNATVGVTASSAVQVDASLQFTDEDLSDPSLIFSLGLTSTSSLSPSALRALILNALASRIRAYMAGSPAVASVLSILSNCSGVPTTLALDVQTTPSNGTPLTAIVLPANSMSSQLGLILGLAIGLGVIVLAAAITAAVLARLYGGVTAAAVVAPADPNLCVAAAPAGPFCVAILTHYGGGDADAGAARLAHFAERLAALARAAAVHAEQASAHREVLWHAFIVEGATAPGAVTPTAAGAACARGVALNAAASAAMRRELLVSCGVDARLRDAGGFDALLIHDIDLAPEDGDATRYLAAVPPSRALAEPVSLGALWPRSRAAPADRALVAGALLLPTAAYAAANGFPNAGCAPGDEDAALQARLDAAGAGPRAPWAPAAAAPTQAPTPAKPAALDARAMVDAPGLAQADYRLVRVRRLADQVSRLTFELY